MPKGIYIRTKNSLNRKLISGESSFNHLYNNYRWHAMQRDIDFLLSKEEFRALTSKDCVYCGEKPKKSHQTKHNYTTKDGNKKSVTSNGEYKYNGIDRVDNTKSYTIENCVTCCYVCNYMKRTMSVSEFQNHITKIFNWMEHNEKNE